MSTAVAEAIEAGVLPGRVWMYSNYHCNLACAYCLTESSPSAPKRDLTADRMIRIAEQAAEMGYTEIGITGGEPFLAASMPETVARIASILPTVVLTNGMLFTEARLDRMAPLADLPVKLQISLDADIAEENDGKRGDENFRKVVETIPRLIERGITVRIATTVDGEPDPAGMERLCTLHRGLGVSDDDHIVRPIIHRGRAIDNHMGLGIEHVNFPAELTITADGAFWSPFGPTIHDGRVDTDLLITRTTDPLSRPAEALLKLVEGRPAGDDANLNIR
jgi:MoaA/NifB/PqqE/SkfB family radical SAM enzyme